MQQEKQYKVFKIRITINVLHKTSAYETKLNRMPFLSQISHFLKMPYNDFW